MGEGESIKLFVGQVPYDWTEKELHEIFGKYGEISSLKILTDRETGRPKGCAFLIYKDNESAKRAQEELHEKRRLPGARSEIQVKPAASEKDEYRKLYVGNLSKRYDENDVMNMFSSYGTVENVNILKNPDGRSRGCGFVKFETQQQAQSAMRSLHNSETMKGCTYPIIVKIADTEKDKFNKKRIYDQHPQHHDNHHHQQQGDTYNQQQGAYNQPQLGALTVPAMGTAGVGGASILNVGQSQLQQQLLAQIALPQLLTSHPGIIGAGAGAGSAAVPGGSMSAIMAAMAMQQQQLQPQFQSLQSDPANFSNAAAQSSYVIPQVTGFGTGMALGSGLSALVGQGQLPGSLQSQLGTLQGQLGGALQSQIVGYFQNPLGVPLQNQLAGSLQNQLGAPIQGQFGTSIQNPLGASVQNPLGGTVQNQLSSTLQQNQLGASIQNPLGSSAQNPLSSPLGGSMQNQLTSSIQNPLGASSQLSAIPTVGAGNLSGYGITNVGGYATMGTGSAAASSTGWTDNTLQQHYSQASSGNMHSSIGLQQQQQQQHQGSIRKEGQGPEGANLFIYQVPPEFTDTDLISSFAPYGNIVSAKIFVDKNTGASKGFGFVSYDNANSANTAISAMNGVTIGSRRLRVQHKRPKEKGRPY